MRKVLIAIAVVVAFFVAPMRPIAIASATTTTTASADDKDGKTVHVKKYKKKDGTTVKAHNRRPPKPKGTSSKKK